MGTIKKGILGGFSGKVGNVVGSNWKSISYMRSIPQKVKNPRTAAQVKHRAKFKMAVDYLRPLAPIIRIGWKDYAKKQSAFNAATTYFIKNVVEPYYVWDMEVNPNKVIISRGTLTPAKQPLITISSTSLIVSWNDNSNVGNASSDDIALVAIVNRAKGEVLMSYKDHTRSSNYGQFTTPKNWIGDVVYFYIGFVSADGKIVADSTYIGLRTIPNL